MSKFILSGFGDEIDKDLDIQTRVMKANGVNFLELRGIDKKGVATFTIDEAKAYKKRLDDAKIKVSCIGSPIGKIFINEPFEDHLETFKHVIELAKVFDTKYIRMFSFFIPEGEDPDKYEDEVIKRWRAFLDAAKGKDVILLHENEKEIYGDIPRRCEKLFDVLDSDQMKLIFDPANFVQCKVETKAAFDLLKDKVIYMHIKDALMESGEVVPAGKGDGNIPYILSELDKNGYEGFLSLEPHLGAFEGLAELELEIDLDKMELAGEKTFTVAADSLKNEIKKVGVKYE